MNSETAHGQAGRRGKTAGVMVLAFVAATLVGLGFALGAALWNDEPAGWRDEPAGVPRAGPEPVEIVPPVPLSGGEAYVLTKVLPSGVLEVTQWIESSQPLDSVLLALPDVAGADELAAQQVRVVADGRVASGPTHVFELAERYRLSGALSVEIKYHLTGAVETSTSAPGRALARSTALDVSYEPPPQRITRTVIAPEVLSMACAPPMAAAPSTPCGVRRSDSEWMVELEGPGAYDRVIAALTLG